MFDWSYFDNSNPRPFVWHQSKVGMFKLDFVWLISPKNLVQLNIIQTKLKNKLSLINVYFDYCIYSRIRREILDGVLTIFFHMQLICGP
jgi:hypothetical protein